MNEAQKQKEELQKEIDYHKEKMGNYACEMFKDTCGISTIIDNLTGTFKCAMYYLFEGGLKRDDGIIFPGEAIIEIKQAIFSTCDLIKHLSIMYDGYIRISSIKEAIEQIEILEAARNPQKEK
ncbi:MAG: hypothetical protein LBK94_06490 [Prevotellaceae bacterium]|jgi:hypothetical protein|nr:hypothetical protein [Prevotellaceae bacterium]